MRIYEGYYNEEPVDEPVSLKSKFKMISSPSCLYDPFVPYDRECDLLEDICHKLGYGEHTLDIVNAISLKALLEDNGVVRYFDNCIDDLVKVVLDNYKDVPKDGNTYNIPTPYVYKYDRSEPDNRKRASVDYGKNHIIHNDILEPDWHQIIIAFVYDIRGYNASTYPRGFHIESIPENERDANCIEYFVPEWEAETWDNTDEVVIKFNTHDLYIHLKFKDTLLSKQKYIKNEFNHELTHVAASFGNRDRDVLCSEQRRIRVDVNDFHFDDDTKINSAVDYAKKMLHDVIDSELQAYYNQGMKELEDADDDYFIELLLRPNKDGWYGYIIKVIEDYSDYNHYGKVMSELNYIKYIKDNINSFNFTLVLLLLGYCLNKYQFCSISSEYINPQFITDYANDNCKLAPKYQELLDVKELNHIYYIVQRTVLGAYRDYTDVILRKKTEKYLKKRFKKLIDEGKIHNSFIEEIVNT